MYNSNTNHRQQQITAQIFSHVLTPVLPSVLIPGIFQAFDENRDGKVLRINERMNESCLVLESIDFKEFVCGISAACRGPEFQRYKCKFIILIIIEFRLVLFRVFDRDYDGILNRSDILYMTSCLIDVAQFTYVPNIHINTSPEVYADRILTPNQSALKLEDFLTWYQKDGLLIELLELIFEICHVVLGLRPITQEEEVTIVK